MLSADERATVRAAIDRTVRANLDPLTAEQRARVETIRRSQPQKLTTTAKPTNRELTRREHQVLRLAADGLTNHEISERLFISTETTQTHVKHLLRKLEARSRTHAVAIALRAALIE